MHLFSSTSSVQVMQGWKWSQAGGEVASVLNQTNRQRSNIHNDKICDWYRMIRYAIYECLYKMASSKLDSSALNATNHGAKWKHLVKSARWIPRCFILGDSSYLNRKWSTSQCRCLRIRFRHIQICRIRFSRMSDYVAMSYRLDRSISANY